MDFIKIGDNGVVQTGCVFGANYKDGVLTIILCKNDNLYIKCTKEDAKKFFNDLASWKKLWSRVE